MNGAMRPYATNAPLKAPSATPVSRPRRMERIGSIPATAVPAAMAPANARSEPTERSMPAPMITTVMPNARSAFTEICLNTFVTFPTVRKRSDRNDSTSVMAMNASSRPNLPSSSRHLFCARDMRGHLLCGERGVELDDRPSIAEDQNPVTQSRQLLRVAGGDDDG